MILGVQEFLLECCYELDRLSPGFVVDIADDALHDFVGRRGNDLVPAGQQPKQAFGGDEQVGKRDELVGVGREQLKQEVGEGSDQLAPRVVGGEERGQFRGVVAMVD